MPRPTIYDVAHAAGVSKSLVSLVLRDSPRVSAASRARVEQAIRDLGYRPSRAAADLAATSTRTIGVLVDDYTNLWFVGLVRGLREILAPAGYRLSVADAATGVNADDAAEGFLAARADGLVVAMHVPDSLRGADLPPIVVASTQADLPPTADAVANDDVQGAEFVAAHLLDLGHTRIGQIVLTEEAGRIRAASFAATLRRAGVDVVSEVGGGAVSEVAGAAAMRRLMTAHPEVTAVFAGNDVLALGALGAAREIGLHVPHDVSVVGYDNSAIADATLVALTTVENRSEDVGREAGRLLLRRLQEPEHGATRSVLSPELVVRSTTAPPYAR